MIRVKNLTVSFGGKTAVNGIDFEINKGEIVGVVGESGSGKSVTALSIMGLLSDEADICGGDVYFEETALLENGRKAEDSVYRTFRGNMISMIFQEPMTSLNPTKRVGAQVAEMLRLHTDTHKDEIRGRVCETFLSVGLKDPDELYDKYPHELSGGMRQRVMIAMGIICKPALIIADEPTTALDVTVQNQIIALLKRICSENTIGLLFITHDLNLAKRICNRVLVMKDGIIVEQGATKDIFEDPRNEYTKRLIEAVPSRIHKKDRGKPGKENVLSVSELNVFYRDGGNSLFSGKSLRHIIKDVSFEIKRGEILGLVGESGCGKTTLSKAVLGLNKNYTGKVEHFSEYPQMIFQDPYSSLNPTKTVGWLLMEPLRAKADQKPGVRYSAEDIRSAAYDMLKKVELSEDTFRKYPAQLSGGQRQMVSIGQALITHPSLVIADEPVSALDVTIQAQIMELMLKLKEDMALSYLFISHDINVVYQMCDRIMVMKSGEIVETGDTREIYESPREEYTRLLLAES